MAQEGALLPSPSSSSDEQAENIPADASRTIKGPSVAIPEARNKTSGTQSNPQVNSRAEKFFRLIFSCLLASLPLAFYPFWGNSFSEPKTATLLLICLLLALRFPVSELKISNLSGYEKLWVAGLASVFAFQMLGSIAVPNLGFAYLRLVMTLALIIIPIGIARSNYSLTSFCKVLLLPCTVVIAGGLAMPLFRIALFSDYSPFGSTIGLKNSLSVFLAQLLPFLAILYLQADSVAARDKVFRVAAILFAALALWVIFMSRTRSAWWMLIIYAATIILSLRRSPDEARRIAGPAGLSSAIAVALFALVPNKLQWTSATPYLDSFTSLVSFDKSSGRVELWQVALAIFKEKPLFGLGTGQYSILWRDYLGLTTIDPRLFAFLRSDLPLFNDYLQVFVENGILPGMAYFITLSALPSVIFLRQGQRKSLNPVNAALLLVCIATAADSFFDYPFQRAENVLLYSMALGFYFRSNLIAQERPAPHSVSERLALRRCLQGALSLFLLYVFILMCTGLTARSIWHKSRDNTSLRIAHTYWPWDMQWAHPHMLRALRTDEPELARDIVESRSRAWPRNAESELMWARYYEHEREFVEAVDRYRRAIIHVPGGNCYHVAYRYYLEMISRAGFPEDIALLTDEEVSACR